MHSTSLINSGLCLLLIWTKISWATCLGLNCTCSISASAINFGGYAPQSGTATDATGTTTVTCSALVLGLAVAYEIQLSTGGSGSYAPRYMISGANHLNYNIYSNASRTQVWGDTTGGTVSVSDNYLLSVSPTVKNYTTYGRIWASQNVAAGSYTDSIVATVIF